MKKRSKSLQEAIDQINAILSKDSVWLDGENLPSNEPVSRAFKMGLATALECLLHRTNTYRGFTYTGPDHVDNRYDRKYF